MNRFAELREAAVMKMSKGLSSFEEMSEVVKELNLMQELSREAC